MVADDPSHDDRPADASEWGVPGASISGSVLERDSLFDALAHPRRRYLVYALARDPEWSLPELATRIAAWEHDVPPETVDEFERRRVLASLHHTHLPKLGDGGVVAVDEDAGIVTPGPRAETVIRAMAAVGDAVDGSRMQCGPGECR